MAARDQNEVGVTMHMCWNLCRRRIRDAVRERYPIRFPCELQVAKEGVVGKDEHDHSLNHQPNKNHVEAFAIMGGVSSPGEFHPEALVEPYMSLSTHTAPIAEPCRVLSCQ